MILVETMTCKALLGLIGFDWLNNLGSGPTGEVDSHMNTEDTVVGFEGMFVIVKLAEHKVEVAFVGEGFGTVETEIEEEFELELGFEFGVEVEPREQHIH